MQSDARTGFRLSTLVDILVHREPHHASDRQDQGPDFQRKNGQHGQVQLEAGSQISSVW